MKVEISDGELLDKLSILKIKEKFIGDTVMFEFPFTANPPLIEVGTFTTNPLFGEIVAVAEPDLI